MTISSIPTWQSLGYSQEALANGMTYSELILHRWWHGPPKSVDEMDYWASAAVSDAYSVFVTGVMGYRHPRPPLDDWHGVGRRCVDAALLYFYGAWRDEFGRTRARADLHWSDYYREALTTAASFGNWQAVNELLQWPGADLPFDEGTDDRTNEDNAYQIWLASRLRGEPPETCALQRASIERGPRRRPKMLLAAADALLSGDHVAFTHALQQYLKQYRKLELRLNRVDLGVAADANTLWHLARHRGLRDLPLTAEAMLLIARP